MNSSKQQVAEGNGMEVSELPRFRQHIHPETGVGVHKSWETCALTWCTWAGSTEAFRVPS